MGRILDKAIEAVNQSGALLVFPIQNRKEPTSLWSVLHPRSKMRWEWDEDGDNRVAELWHLREQLSSSGKVVYSKWFQGRATLFSMPIYCALLRLLNGSENWRENLGAPEAQFLQILADNSPLSAKVLKRESGLDEKSYNRITKSLWSRLLLVGFGEVDDGAFPSLAVGASFAIFEKEWKKAFEMETAQAMKIATKTLGPDNLFLRYAAKLQMKIPAAIKAPAAPKEIAWEQLGQR